jgi:hypothetical protein
MNRACLAVLLPLSFGLPACSGSNGGSDPAGPQNANVAGTWDYDATNLSGSVAGFSVSCAVRDAVLLLDQQGTSFSGTRDAGILECVGEGKQDEVRLDAPNPIRGGQVSGNQIKFGYIGPFNVPFLVTFLQEVTGATIGAVTASYDHSGTASGNSMSGTIAVEAGFGPNVGVLSMTGNWSATRR